MIFYTTINGAEYEVKFTHEPDEYTLKVVKLMLNEKTDPIDRFVDDEGRIFTLNPINVGYEVLFIGRKSGSMTDYWVEPELVANAIDWGLIVLEIEKYRDEIKKG